MKRNKNIKIFKSFKVNDVGINYFIPNDVDAYNKNKPCHGFGEIIYAEGSIYTGEVYFDGINYHKLGFGKQDFTYSTLSNIDPIINQKIYMFIGEFDYRKSNWIYGNGVLYYRDVNNKESSFVKGFFSCLDKIKEYKGEFDYSLLLNGYNKEMESNYVKKFSLIDSEINNLKNLKEYETLFIGDSYFEFWHYKEFAGKTFYEAFDINKTLNIGVGGTKYKDWLELLDNITYFPKFKNIVLNLGFNDLHYAVDSRPNNVYNHMVKVLDKINIIFDNPNIYVLNVCHSPANVALYNKEVKFNEILKKNAKKLNIHLIDNSKLINEKNNTINVFDKDNVHLNPIGYDVMLNIIKENIK